MWQKAQPRNFVVKKRGTNLMLKKVDRQKKTEKEELVEHLTTIKMNATGRYQDWV